LIILGCNLDFFGVNSIGLFYFKEYWILLLENYEKAIRTCDTNLNPKNYSY